MSLQLTLFEEHRIHLLIDPDHWSIGTLTKLLECRPDIIGTILVGGTFMHSANTSEITKACSLFKVPVGNLLTVGLPDQLIDVSAQFVILPVLLGSKSTAFITDHIINAVPLLRRTGILAIPLGYLVVDGGVATSAQFFTQTLPIPHGKLEIIESLSYAARLMGLPAIYLEAGSSAIHPITKEEIAAARDASELPILVGGGISSAKLAAELFAAGATGLVVGSSIECSGSLEWLWDID